MDKGHLDRYYCKILKDKDQRIAELEEELENSNFDIDNYDSKYTKLMEAKRKIENRLVECGKKLRKQQEENAKLKEQLKNAMKIPDEIMNFIIDCTYVKELDYSNINDYVNKLKAEAQKYLEEHNG